MIVPETYQEFIARRRQERAERIAMSKALAFALALAIAGIWLLG